MSGKNFLILIVLAIIFGLFFAHLTIQDLNRDKRGINIQPPVVSVVAENNLNEIVAREYCVNGYSFVSISDKNGNVGLTQIFIENSNNMGMIPKRCE